MKKVRLVSLLFILSLVICSCSPQSNAPDPILSSAVWDVSIGDIRFTLQTNAGDSDAVVRFSEPEILKEMEVSIKDGELRAVYDGLETKISKQFLGAVYPFYEALMALRTSEKSDNNTTVEINDRLFSAFRDNNGNYTHFEVKGNDGTHTSYVILSVTICNDDTESSGKSSPGSNP